MKKRKKADEKPVIISIRGEQGGGDHDSEVVEFITSGSLAKVGNIFEITYRESEITGMNGTETKLSVDGQRVVVERSGTVSTQMIFEKGQKHLSLYDTPLGAMLVGVNASAVTTEFNECGGSLTVDYSVEIDNALAGYNRVSMVVSQKGSLPAGDAVLGQ